MKTKDEVIKRICELAGQVGYHLQNKYPGSTRLRDGYHLQNKYAADCFCAESEQPPEYFRFEPEIMKFIEEAIQEKMNK